MTALASPMVVSSLPLRGIAFALRGPDPSKIQLLIHTDIGSGYTAAARVTVAYAVLDAEGRAVDGQPRAHLWTGAWPVDDAPRRVLPVSARRCWVR